MLLFFAIILAETALAELQAAQTAPADATTLTSPNVTFTCTGTESTSVILNINLTGTFVRNYTAAGTDLSYTIYNIPNGVYNWNCIAANSTPAEAASANRTFTVNFASTSFSGTIPNKNFTVGTTASNAFDLDTYFTGATSFTVKGNSTITVSIASDNQVSFSASTPANETINFTSGSAVSNNILLSAASAVAASNITCTAIPNQTWAKNANTTIPLGTYCSGATNMTYTSSTAPHITITIANGTARLVPEQDWIGESAVRFTATAGASSTSTNNITLKVTGLSNPPKINTALPAADPKLPPGGMQVFTITKSGSGNLTVKWYLDDSQVSTADSYTYKDATNGTHTIKVVVSDGTQETTKSWTATVQAAQEEQKAETPSILTESEKGPKCGDGSCDSTENCGACEEDCICASDKICENNKCAPKPKTNTGILLTILISAIVIGGGAVGYFLITKKPKDLPQNEANMDKIEVHPASEITDFYVKMPPPETKAKNPLEAYITKARGDGLTDDQIKKNLKEKGWTQQQVEDAFRTA